MKHGHWLLIIVAPLVLTGGCWLAIDHRTPAWDWMALSVGVCVGLTGIWSAPWRTASQVWVTTAYVPLMGAALGAGVLFF